MNNPYLWPAREKPVKLVYRLLRLDTAQRELTNAGLAIGSAVAEKGYGWPTEDVVARHTGFRATQDRITLTFPPAAPEEGEMINVCDRSWNCSTILYTPQAREALEHPRTRFYFDLWAGGWVVFTGQDLPAAHAGPYESAAARYPIPEDA